MSLNNKTKECAKHKCFLILSMKTIAWFLQTVSANKLEIYLQIYIYETVVL